MSKLTLILSDEGKPFLVTVATNGTIVIPSKIKTILDIRTNDKVAFVEDSDSNVIIKKFCSDKLIEILKEEINRK